MNTKQYNKSELETIFSHKLTENGDNAFSTTGNTLVDILFMAEYYTKHPKEVIIDNSPVAKLFSMFMRDPRFGMGYRDLGRNLMYLADLTAEEVVKCGRYDDLFLVPKDCELNSEWIKYLFTEVYNGNELAKKWMPRYSSKHLMIAREFARFLGLNKQQYGKLIKANTVENTMSRNNWESIEFEHLPSLASIKYVKAFEKHQPERYKQYLNDVKAGKKQLHIATTTVYDIYKNRTSIDADLFFSKIEKISGSWIPIVDSSGSMQDKNDSYGKAMAIGHYLAKCSTYCPNQVISFSSYPQLITLGNNPRVRPSYWYSTTLRENASVYEKEIHSMHTGDCSNTDFGAVMNLLSNLKTDMPEYLVVLSDMEFDEGSSISKDDTMQLFKSKGWNTKIIWWNFNSRNKTAPETDDYGNIFISGYSPMMLKYLETGFNAQQFLQKLLGEYAKNIGYTLS